MHWEKVFIKSIWSLFLLIICGGIVLLSVAALRQAPKQISKITSKNASKIGSRFSAKGLRRVQVALLGTLAVDNIVAKIVDNPKEVVVEKLTKAIAKDANVEPELSVFINNSPDIFAKLLKDISQKMFEKGAEELVKEFLKSFENKDEIYQKYTSKSQNYLIGHKRFMNEGMRRFQPVLVKLGIPTGALIAQRAIVLSLLSTEQEITGFYGRDLAIALGRLSTFALCYGKFDEALAAAKLAVSIDTAMLKRSSVQSGNLHRSILNSAHALMMTGRTTDAFKIYSVGKKDQVQVGETKWITLIERDFYMLQTCGIKHKFMGEVMTVLLLS